MADHTHNIPVCGFDAHKPHAPSCANMHGRMIACGTIVDPTHPDLGKALCRHKDGPWWNPGKWNGGIQQGTNNCYNYATDRKTGTNAIPGRGGGHIRTARTCTEYTRAAVADGLTPIDYDKECQSGCWKVVLVVWNGFDFHFYRQDDDGNWSDKPGRTPAKNTGDTGNVITDPRTQVKPINQNSNYEYCGSFCVCPPVTIASRTGSQFGEEVAMHDKPTVEVSVLIYSGEPNPAWALTDSMIFELSKQIKINMEYPAEKFPERPALGYNGLELVNQNKVPNFPDQIRVYRGVMAIKKGEQISYYYDKANTERMVLEPGLKTIHNNIVGNIIKNLGNNYFSGNKGDLPKGF